MVLRALAALFALAVNSADGPPLAAVPGNDAAALANQALVDERTASGELIMSSEYSDASRRRFLF